MPAILYSTLFWAILSFSAEASIASAPKYREASLNDVYAAGYLADAFGQLKGGQLKIATIKNLKLSANQSPLFKEFLPEINQLLEISLLDNTILSFIKECRDVKSEESWPSLRKELGERMNTYCHQRFLTDYFIGKTLNAMDSLRYDHLRKWMVYYLKGESKTAFLSVLKRLQPDSSIHREISFLITEQAIANKLYPSEEILSYIDVDRNLNIHVRRMSQNDLAGKKYFSEEFVRLGNIVSNSIDVGNKEEILDLVSQLEHFYTENKEFIDPESAWKTFLSTGRKLLLKNYDEQAFNLLSFASETGEADQKQEAIFYQLLGHLLNNNNDKALAFIERNQLLKNFDKLSSKLKFWIADTLLINKKNKEAQEYFARLVQSSPLTFYSIMGMKSLMKMTNKTSSDIMRENFQEQSTHKLIPLAEFSKATQNNYARLNIWAQKGLETLANLEITDLQKTTIKTAQINDKIYSNQEFEHSLYSHIITILAEKKRYLLTFKVASLALEQGAIKTDKILLGKLFPTELLPTVKRNTKLDPFLIMALIRQESAFNPEATSSVGARGLMQLLPKTAKKFRRAANKKNLGNPSLNIEVGSKYFNYLLKMFDGNLVFALAAYNAGEGRVKEWRRNLFPSEDPLLLIESIPYKETRDYVKLIYRNLFYYKLLFDQLDTSSVEQSFKISFEASESSPTL